MADHRNSCRGGSQFAVSLAEHWFLGEMLILNQPLDNAGIYEKLVLMAPWSVTMCGKP